MKRTKDLASIWKLAFLYLLTNESGCFADTNLRNNAITREDENYFMAVSDPQKVKDDIGRENTNHNFVEKIESYQKPAILPNDEDVKKFTSLLSLSTSSFDLNVSTAGLAELKELTTNMQIVMSALSDLELTASLPQSIKNNVDNLMNGLGNANAAMNQIAGLIEERTNLNSGFSHLVQDTSPAQLRVLHTSDNNRSTTNATTPKFNSGRAKTNTYGYEKVNTNGYERNRKYTSKHFFANANRVKQNYRDDHYYQYGHSVHGASSNHRFLRNEDGVCVAEDGVEYKNRQCERLFDCAESYTMYDLLVYMYGDDINFDTGELRSGNTQKITFFDDKDMKAKFEKITNILTNFRLPDDCNSLLQEFHRYDEKLGGLSDTDVLIGKWQGGTVNSVCRGADTTKDISFKAIHNIIRYASYGEYSIPDRCIWEFQSMILTHTDKCMHWSQWGNSYICATPQHTIHNSDGIDDPVWPSDFRYSVDTTPQGYTCTSLDKSSHFCWKSEKKNPEITWVGENNASLRCTDISHSTETSKYLCVPKHSYLDFTWADNMLDVSEKSECFKAEMFAIDIFQDMVTCTGQIGEKLQDPTHPLFTDDTQTNAFVNGAKLVLPDHFIYDDNAIPTSELNPKAWDQGFTVAYNDDGTGSDVTWFIYIVNPPDDYYSLGDYCQKGGVDPNGRIQVIVVKPTNPDFYSHPVDFKLIWNDAGSGGDNRGALWEPICKAGYVALGLVSSPFDTYTKPLTIRCVCLRNDLVVEAKAGEIVAIESSGNYAISIFREIVPVNREKGLRTGTFFRYKDSDGIPSDNSLYNSIKIVEDVNSDNRDDYGQVEYTKLDEFLDFNYFDGVNPATGSGKILFSDNLRKDMLRHMLASDEKLVEFESAVLRALSLEHDDDKKASLHNCLFEYECPDGKWEGEYMKFNDRRPLPLVDLDNAMTYIFGDDVSAGKICQFANALEIGKVDNAPGYCCLDAPYERNDYWGEKYSCTIEHGVNKGSLRGVEECSTIAPYTAGFSESACDIFSGTWCHYPRSCEVLVACINDCKDMASTRENQKAFLTYLEGAPQPKSYDNAVECGRLRSYLDFDSEYPDDEKICEDVEALQCRDDFTNLDDFASGVGVGEGKNKLVELFIDDKVVRTSLESFDSDAAKIWRSANFGLGKAVDVLTLGVELIESSKQVCLDFVSALPGTATPCTTALVMLDTIAKIGLGIAATVISISEYIYSEVVDEGDDDADSEEISAIYENVITNNFNIKQTFAAIRQVKLMLGDISDKLDEDDNDSSRMIMKQCVINNVCSKGVCSCSDPKFDCDCKLDYTYLRDLSGAGCDGIDSDGDKDTLIDMCEDRYKPSILLLKSDLFISHEREITDYRFTDEVFLSHDHVHNFFMYQARVDDDCASSNQLAMDIEHIGGTCNDTTYQLTPIQNYNECNNRTQGTIDKKGELIPFINPLYGKSIDFIVNVDDESPIVECGFYDKNDSDIIQDKTLFIDPSETRDMVNSHFYYRIQENCPADVKVEISVRSNEYDFDSKMVQIVQYKTGQYNEQAGVFISANSCGSSGHACWFDHSVESSTIRFYEINVVATDSAGHVGTDTCRVINVPSGESFNDKDIQDYLCNLANKATKMHDLAYMTLEWKSYLPTNTYCDNALYTNVNGVCIPLTNRGDTELVYVSNNDDSLTFEAHEVTANLCGGHLASITSDQEQLLVVNLLQANAKGDSIPHFLGAMQSQPCTGGPLACWQWYDGSIWDYTNWVSKDIHGVDEDCSLIRILNPDPDWIQLGVTLEGSEENDNFGDSVSLSRGGRRMAVGGYNVNNGSGSVKVYDVINDSFVQVGDDISGDREVEGIFQYGRVVSMSEDGNRVAISAPGGSGGVLVYEWLNNNVFSGGNWNRIGSIVSIFACFALAMSGDGTRFVAGARGRVGIAYVYEWTDADWALVGEISGINANENFAAYGLSMSFNGKKFIGGSSYVLYQNPDEGAGNARVYEEIALNDWKQLGGDLELIDGVTGDRFGYSVDMSKSGARVVVGAPGTNNSNGSAYVYEIINSSWQLVGTVFGNGRFGYDISMSDNGKRFAVGSYNSPAAASIYEDVTDVTSSFSLETDDFGCGSNESGGMLEWSLVGKNSIDGPYSFGKAISLSSDGTSIAIGGPQVDSKKGIVSMYTVPHNDGWYDAKCDLPQGGLYLLPLDYNTRCKLFTEAPSTNPTTYPSVSPTTLPSSEPTNPPSSAPSISPTSVPSSAPTNRPSSSPSIFPTNVPSSAPTNLPSSAPSISPAPTNVSSACNCECNLSLESCPIGTTLNVDKCQCESCGICDATTKTQCLLQQCLYKFYPNDGPLNGKVGKCVWRDYNGDGTKECGCPQSECHLQGKQKKKKCIATNCDIGIKCEINPTLPKNSQCDCPGP